MTEMILETSTLPETIMRLIHTKNVKMRELGGKIEITPICEEESDCPLLGMFADGKVSSYKFESQKRAEKELEL
jgi:hypothetical protein